MIGLSAKSGKYQFDYVKYQKVLQFMTDSMHKDAHSETANLIRKLNSNAAGRPAAYALFAGMVLKPWDYKPKIEPSVHRFNIPQDIGTFKKDTPFLGTGIQGDNTYFYYYDIWSNIHYGYIGRAVGFSKKDLVLGSLAHDSLKDISIGESVDDTASVEIGMEIFEKEKMRLNSGIVHSVVHRSRGRWSRTSVKLTPKELGLE